MSASVSGCIEVDVGTYLSPLKQFLFQHMKSCINILNLVENLERRVIEGDIKVDSWPNLSSVVVQTSEIQSSLSVFVFSTAYDVLISLVQSLDLTSTKVIMTGELHLLEHIHRVIVPPSGKKMELEEPTNVFSINQAQLQCNTYSLPDGYVVDKVHLDDIDFVCSKWPHMRGSEDIERFRFMAENLETVAVYTVVDGGKKKEIASWVFEGTEGQLSHLFTVPEHRNKGLGSYVVQEMCRRLLGKGQQPFVNIVCGNKASEKLFTNFGFSKVAFTFQVH